MSHQDLQVTVIRSKTVTFFSQSTLPSRRDRNGAAGAIGIRLLLHLPHRAFKGPKAVCGCPVQNPWLNTPLHEVVCFFSLLSVLTSCNQALHTIYHTYIFIYMLITCYIFLYISMCESMNI